MKKQVIFHEKYYSNYAFDPAAEDGRMEAIIEELTDFNIISPLPATDEDVLLIHTENHLARVKADREQVYNIALLAVGGVILAAEHACRQEPIFAVIRPPGHHASPEGYWGFCYFNNSINQIRTFYLCCSPAEFDFCIYFIILKIFFSHLNCFCCDSFTFKIINTFKIRIFMNC